MDDEDWKDRIEIDPAISCGKPVVRGTRIAVEFVVQLLASGWTHKLILDNYPGLQEEDIRACLWFAHETLQDARKSPLHA